MNQHKPRAARGRPPTITRERLADAGIAMGLPKMTVVGVAAQLGVSHMAIYKHVSGLEELKKLVAEEIFFRWNLPSIPNGGRDVLEDYLTSFSTSIWKLVDEHPGIAPYLLRGEMVTPAIMAKIRAHQKEMAGVCGISFEQSRWLFFTVAYHCIAIADTALPRTTTEGGDEPTGRSARNRNLIPPEHASGIRALIVGALSIFNDPQTDLTHP